MNKEEVRGERTEQEHTNQPQAHSAVRRQCKEDQRPKNVELLLDAERP